LFELFTGAQKIIRFFSVAQKSSAMNDEKVAEIVAQLGTISTEKNELIKTNAEHETRIKVSFFFF